MKSLRSTCLFFITWTLVAGCHELGSLGLVGGECPRSDAAVSDAAAPAAIGDAQSPRETDGSDRSHERDDDAADQPCRALSSSEAVPARDAVTSAEKKKKKEPEKRSIFTRDIFGQFKSNCGACHVDPVQGLGGFSAKTVADFAAATKDRQQKILDKIHSDDPAFFMPPPGQANSKPWSEREKGDPVVELAGLLEAWFKAGSPPDLFTVAVENAADDEEPAEQSYLMPKDVAENLTNIGNCLPAKAVIGREKVAMNELDAFFESATALPESLSQTDLVTFDSDVLAKNGVISFAPAYPLFSDNARKMRHVRVPRGASIEFDKDMQEFSIPANTRVYKTFFKKIVDADGNERYRKIETRLIVSRPDGEDEADGSHVTNALFGAYAWNEAETEATLVTDPLRNGQPFRDRLLTYFVDEAKATEVLAGDPYNKEVALSAAHATRNYAIPGSERCVQCHMGSHNHSFVLGMTPLQIKRRAPGEGGVYEDASEDEQAQLERLIDYGLITGVDSPDDILPLEESQGKRKPRNEYELGAQGYMLGNCAHCHNPRGLPTVQNSVLKDLLRFFPDADGGIFQFPLDRVSPRIKRGDKQDVDIPYITPSLFDLEAPVVGGIYAPKWISDGADGHYLAAPWRSLIYRNVESPFPFSEDYALYPHMPMNAVGFDCRAPRILGDWMVSIPALPPAHELGQLAGNEALDPNARFVEVPEDDPMYDAAARLAKERLDAYHKGGRAQYDVLNGHENRPGTWDRTFLAPYRYSDYCPDTSDIIDPDVQPGVQDKLTPQDHSSLPSLRVELQDDDSIRGKFAAMTDGVPDRPHWVVTDVTDAPGPWYPRRPDWADVLVDQKLDGADALQQEVVETLQGITLSQAFRSFATTPLPFGLWAKKDGCDFSSVPKMSSLTGDAVPAWAAIKAPEPQDSDPVYVQSPGAMAFNQICINCHGPKFDSRGRQADTLLMMTGGDTRVANLRDGLLGPADKPGDNRQRVFGAHASSSVSADDWTARYVAWMGLGGTTRVIPYSILNIVGTTQVLGQPRPALVSAGSANMLAIAQTLCKHTLGVREAYGPAGFDVDTGALALGKGTGFALIADNGDAETWTALCAFETHVPVRALTMTTKITLSSASDVPTAWYDATTYPGSAPVGDQRGKIANGVASANYAPWCIKAPTDAGTQAELDKLQAARSAEQGPLPICPTDWLTDTNRLSDVELNSWSLRAAMNAGFAVFLYLDQLERDAKDGKSPQPAYDHCEEIEH